MALETGKAAALIGTFLLVVPAAVVDSRAQAATASAQARPQGSAVAAKSGAPTRDTPALESAAASGAATRALNSEAGEAKSKEQGMSGFGSLSFTEVDEPIVVEADRLEFDYEKNRLVYKGSVHVVQGNFELSSDTLVITFQRAGDLERAQLREVIARGDVVITQQDRQASGRVAVFNQETRKIVLRGNPVLRDGANEVQGDRITVYLDEGRTVVDAAPRKRVSAVLYPGSAEEDETVGEAPGSQEEAGETP